MISVWAGEVEWDRNVAQAEKCKKALRKSWIPGKRESDTEG